MSFDFSEVAELMGKPGVTVMKFCGMSDDDETTCDQEAVGDIIIPVGEGATFPMPVCQGHLETIMRDYSVEELDI